jgi:putative transposase
MKGNFHVRFCRRVRVATLVLSQRWSLHPTKRRITITDKKGIGELKLLGKWDIHTYPVKAIKRVRLVRREAWILLSVCSKC